MHFPGICAQWVMMEVLKTMVSVSPPIMATMLSATEHARYFLARDLLLSCVSTSACVCVGGGGVVWVCVGGCVCVGGWVGGCINWSL